MSDPVPNDARRSHSLFATAEYAMSDAFVAITREMNDISHRYNLPDHADINRVRFPWAKGLLSAPEFYASRTWEYPFAVLSAELVPGMRCADIGCGMTPFTVYLREHAECEVVGVDPDVFGSGERYKCHGVSREFMGRTGLDIVQAAMTELPLQSDTFDRVFCLSVIEHVSADVVRRGVQEMARILKPGGRLIVTVDVNMHSRLGRPLDIVWDSGLLPVGEMDLLWPVQRFGVFCDGKQPADVFGLILAKSDRLVHTRYAPAENCADVPKAPQHTIPVLRASARAAALRSRPLWRRMASRLKKSLAALIRD